MSGIVQKFFFVTALVFFGVACSGGDAEEPRREPNSKVTPPSVNPGARVLDVATCGGATMPTPTGLIVGEAPREVHLYLDGSASMKPFAGQGDRFRGVLIALRPVLLDLGVRRSRVAKVGDAVEVLDHFGGFERFDSPSFYSRGETNLAAALDELDAADSSAVTIVITDGVTSLLRDRGRAGELGECERGSDMDCLTLKVGRLIEAGKGFWLVGFRSRFHGNLFSETLRVGGASLGPVDLPGRPFYLWVITAHPPTGRALVSRLLDRLSVASDGQQAFAVELAPGKIPWTVPGEEEPQADSQLIPEGATAGAVRSGFVPADRGEAPLQKVAHRDLEGTAFGLRLSLEPTPLYEMPESITPLSVYRSVYCLRWTGNAPRGNIRMRASEEKGLLRLALLTSSFAPLAGKRTTLVQQLVRNTSAEGLPNWLGAWSTSDDSTVEAGSRTLNLEEFVRALEARLDPPGRLEQSILRIEFE